MKFALEHQNPLVAGVVTGGNTYPETSYSLLTIDNPNVLLWALKPADDGIAQGVIARLWNLSSSSLDFQMAFPHHSILSADQTTHIETPIGPATVLDGILSGALTTQQMKTYAVRLGSPPLGTPRYSKSGRQAILPIRQQLDMPPSGVVLSMHGWGPASPRAMTSTSASPDAFPDTEFDSIRTTLARTLLKLTSLPAPDSARSTVWQRRRWRRNRHTA